MTDRIFLDTNIVVYAHDRSSGERHVAARDIVDLLWESRKGMLSVQVLQEFYVCVTRKIPNPLKPELAGKIVRYLANWDVVINDAHSVLVAIDLQEKHRLSFWDSLVLQSAIRGGAALLFSEDLADGRILEGVRIVDPFLHDWRRIVQQ